MPSQSRRAAGQIIPKGPDKWLVRVFVGHDPVKRTPRGDPKRIYASEAVTGNATAAKKALTALQRKVDAGKYVTPRKDTVGEFLQRWLDEATHDLSPQTRETYRRNLRLYVTPQIGEVELTKLAPLDVQRMVNKLSIHPCRHREGETLSPRTVESAYSVLRTALEKARAWRMIEANPCTHITLPRKVKKKKRIIQPEDFQRFLQAALGHKHGTLLILYLCTGVRPGEALGVLWEDMDLESATWTVQHNLVRLREKKAWLLKEPKTEAGQRTVAIPPSLVAMLREQRVRSQRYAESVIWEEHGLVFADLRGKPLHRETVTNALKQVLRDAGLPDNLNLYSLRHSMATAMMSMGEHPRVMADQLGHDDAAFTMRTYTHPTSKMLRGVANRVESTFFGAAHHSAHLAAPEAPESP